MIRAIREIRAVAAYVCAKVIKKGEKWGNKMQKKWHER